MGTEENEGRTKLLRDMKITKGVRFNASERLENEEWNLTRNIAYASTMVVVVTLLPIFFEMSVFNERIVSIVTVALSILILSISLLQSANGRHVRADKLKRCALEVNSLLRELQAAGDNADLALYSKKYDDVLSKYSVTHERHDYNRYRIDHIDEYAHLQDKEIKKIRREVWLSESYPLIMRISIFGICAALIILSWSRS